MGIYTKISFSLNVKVFKHIFLFYFKFWFEILIWNENSKFWFRIKICNFNFQVALKNGNIDLYILQSITDFQGVYTLTVSIGLRIVDFPLI